MRNIIVIIILIFSVITVNAQDQSKKSRKELRAEKKAQKAEEVKKLVDNKDFVFDARTAIPMQGGTVNLTTLYNVRLSNDSIFSYLPYYGVAYRVEYGSMESPVNFNAPIQEMNTEKTKDGYMVRVKVKNGMDNLDYRFNISETGMTTLAVNSTDRQLITYYGEINTKEGKND